MARHLIMILVEDVSGSDFLNTKEDLEQEADRIVFLSGSGAFTKEGAQIVRNARRVVVECDPDVDVDEIAGDYYLDLEEQLSS